MLWLKIENKSLISAYGQICGCASQGMLVFKDVITCFGALFFLFSCLTFGALPGFILFIAFEMLAASIYLTTWENVWFAHIVALVLSPVLVVTAAVCWGLYQHVAVALSKQACLAECASERRECSTELLSSLDSNLCFI